MLRATYSVNKYETYEVGVIVIAVWDDVWLDEQVLEEDGKGDEFESRASRHGAGLCSNLGWLCRTR